MHLFNQTINSFSSQVADLPISFNPDIFEANLVNLVLLTGGVFYLGSNALSESLTERQQKILGAIQESEERLQQAVIRLEESDTQLKQAQLVIESIKTDAEATSKVVKSGILSDGKDEIERLTASAKTQIGTIEAKVRKQISDYVVTLALQRVTVQLEGNIGSNLQQQIIDTNISKLGS
jgi:F0F1-type ATP synthase membrane subunit b/b'